MAAAPDHVTARIHTVSRNPAMRDTSPLVGVAQWPQAPARAVEERNGAHRRTPEDLGGTATADNVREVGTDGEAPTGTETHGPDTLAIPEIATTAPAAVRASALETDPQREDAERIKAKPRDCPSNLHKLGGPTNAATLAHQPLHQAAAPLSALARRPSLDKKRAEATGNRFPLQLDDDQLKDPTQGSTSDHAPTNRTLALKPVVGKADHHDESQKSTTPQRSRLRTTPRRRPATLDLAMIPAEAEAEVITLTPGTQLSHIDCARYAISHLSLWTHPNSLERIGSVHFVILLTPG